jgi:WhiB family redox-sensing transcriptional regulator
MVTRRRPAWAVASNLMTLLSDTEEEWRLQARCRFSINAERWYSSNYADQYIAKQICRACPVQIQCYDYATKHRDTWGVWGGVTQRDRRRRWARQDRLATRVT